MAEQKTRRSLVLASGSRTRFEMLKSAGLAFTVDPADIDEQEIRDKAVQKDPPLTPKEIARELACAKAMAMVPFHETEIIIGADQILAAHDTIYAKPGNREEAFETLMSLRGKTHALHSGVAITMAGKIHWQHVETAHLTMRNLSEEFAHDYLRRIGDDAFQSVGAYQLEGPGIQLFDRIEGDYFTILGLPLLPLLKQLRTMGDLPT